MWVEKRRCYKRREEVTREEKIEEQIRGEVVIVPVSLCAVLPRRVSTRAVIIFRTGTGAVVLLSISASLPSLLAALSLSNHSNIRSMWHYNINNNNNIVRLGCLVWGGFWGSKVYTILYCIVFYRDCERNKTEREESFPSSSDQYSDNTSILVDRETSAILQQQHHTTISAWQSAVLSV